MKLISVEGEKRLKFFMTDIHGDDKGVDILLKHAEVDFTVDQIVFGGDYIDRGKRSGRVIKRIKKLADTYHNIIVLMGNHEEMMREYYENKDKLWLMHGGRDTIKDLEKTFPSEEERVEHIEWVCNLPLVYEDDEFVYTHAGLNPYEPLEMQSRDILWMPESEFYSIPCDSLKALTKNKPIIHGHTPVERIYFDGIRLNADMGSNTYMIEEERGLGLVNLTEMVYWVYKPALEKIEKREIARI